MVKRLLAGKDDAAALTQQLAALRAEGRDASLAIEELTQERRQAESYALACQVDAKIAEQQWIVEHCAAAIPELERRLGAVRAIDQAEALARHRGVIGAFFPRLRAALIEAGKIQAEAIQARQLAVAEIGENAVAVNIPFLAYRGLIDDALIGMWVAEQERVWAPPARSRRQPVRAALPAPAKSKQAVAVAKEPAPRAAREPIRDSAPADDGERLLTILRNGVEVENRQLAVGDIVRVRADLASQLLRSGSAELARESADG